MMEWKKANRVVNDEGTTITYTADGTDLTIESRKRHIPHAGGRPGTWDHTSYFVIQDGQEKEFWSLSDAKEYAEGL